jgi:hypothetical protein
MRRLVQTSKGPLQLDLSAFLKKVEVRVHPFDEQGWEEADVRWKEGSGDLATALIDRFGLERDEADTIAHESLQQWRERDGPAQDHIGASGWAIVLGVMGAPLLAVKAVAALIVVLVIWLT